MRKYVDQAVSTAQSYAHETALTKRVREWEERIKPKLKNEVRERERERERGEVLVKI